MTYKVSNGTLSLYSLTHARQPRCFRPHRTPNRARVRILQTRRSPSPQWRHRLRVPLRNAAQVSIITSDICRTSLSTRMSGGPVSGCVPRWAAARHDPCCRCPDTCSPRHSSVEKRPPQIQSHEVFRYYSSHSQKISHWLGAATKLRCNEKYDSSKFRIPSCGECFFENRLRFDKIGANKTASAVTSDKLYAPGRSWAKRQVNTKLNVDKNWTHFEEYNDSLSVVEYAA